MMIYDLFEHEGLLDDYNNLSHKNLIHAEEFLKLSRDADVDLNTVIFGTVNRLHLIKNKMKNNQSFQENAVCVDVKNLLAWVEEQRGLPASGIADCEPDDKDDEEEPSLFAEEEEPLTDEEDDEAEPLIEEDAAEPLVVEEDVREETSCSCKFIFEYFAQSVQISAIAAGFSEHDYKPKELAYAFIKSLSAGD